MSDEPRRSSRLRKKSQKQIDSENSEARIYRRTMLLPDSDFDEEDDAPQGAAGASSAAAYYPPKKKQRTSQAAYQRETAQARREVYAYQEEAARQELENRRRLQYYDEEERLRAREALRAAQAQQQAAQDVAQQAARALLQPVAAPVTPVPAPAKKAATVIDLDSDNEDEDGDVQMVSESSYPAAAVAPPVPEVYAQLPPPKAESAAPAVAPVVESAFAAQGAVKPEMSRIVSAITRAAQEATRAPAPAPAPSRYAVQAALDVLDPDYVPSSKRVINLVKATATEADIAIDTKIYKQLKEHQLEGVRFCWTNICSQVQERHRGCIIAHSMGLGKTLQMIVFIKYFLKEKRGKRVMIVAPKSVLYNWVRELRNTWRSLIGDIPTHFIDDTVYTATQRKNMLKDWEEDCGCFLASYEMVTNLITEDDSAADDPSGLKKYARKMICERTDLLICDEGHMIKNPETKRYKAMYTIRTRNRILLTGTPLYNHLMEYYTMISFVRPNMWSKDEFRVLFDEPIVEGSRADSNPGAVELMKKAAFNLTKQLKPFVHRKDHTILRGALPPKYEYVISVKLTEFYRTLYRLFVRAAHDKAVREKKDLEESYMTNILYYTAMLLKVLDHPDMLLKYCERKEIEAEHVTAGAHTRKIYQIHSMRQEYQEHRYVSRTTAVDEDDDEDMQALLDLDIYATGSSASSSAAASSSSKYKASKKKDKKSSKKSKKSKLAAAYSAAAAADEPEENAGEEGEEEVEINYEDYRIRVRSSSSSSRGYQQYNQRNASYYAKSAVDAEEDDDYLWANAGDDVIEESEVEVGRLDNSWMIPVLVSNYKKANAKNSSKMLLLLRIIEETLRNQGEKLLVFSTYVEALDAIEAVLAEHPLRIGEGPDGNDETILRRDVHYFRMDGSTDLSKRSSMTQEFNQESSEKRVFFISTRTGIGINLVGANRVVIFDVNWNTTIDQYAIFRAYRYGQTRPVHVYRFVASMTSEETVFKLCMMKQWQFLKLVDEKNPVRSLTEADFNMYQFDQEQPAQVEDLDEDYFQEDDVLQAIVNSEDEASNRAWRQKIKYIVRHESLFPDDIADKLPEDQERLAEQEYRDRLNRHRSGQELLVPTEDDSELAAAAAAAAGPRRGRGGAGRGDIAALLGAGAPAGASMDAFLRAILAKNARRR